MDVNTVSCSNVLDYQNTSLTADFLQLMNEAGFNKTITNATLTACLTLLNRCSLLSCFDLAEEVNNQIKVGCHDNGYGCHSSFLPPLPLCVFFLIFVVPMLSIASGMAFFALDGIFFSQALRRSLAQFYNRLTHPLFDVDKSKTAEKLQNKRLSDFQTEKTAVQDKRFCSDFFKNVVRVVRHEQKVAAKSHLAPEF